LKLGSNGSYAALIGIVVGRDVSNNLTVAIGIDSALENDIVPFTYTRARERTRPLIGGVILNWVGTLSYPAVNITSGQRGVITVAHLTGYRNESVY
jgi:hypothetical protein